MELRTIVSSLLFSFLLFIVPTHLGQAIPKSQFEQLVENAFNGKIDSTPADYVAIEKNLSDAVAQDPGLKQAAPAFAMEAAQVYLNNGRIQEAVWALEKGGLYSEAELIVQKVQDYFSNATPELGQYVGKGVSRSVFGKVGNLQVVIKPEDRAMSSDSEVWSYQLDRILGINLVPIAVKRNIKGVDYSIHLLIPGARDSGLNFRDSGYKAEYSDFYFLDFMIDHVDRHYQNSMFAPSGRIFAIDHGRVFGTSAEYQRKFSGFDSKFVPSPRLYQNLKTITAAQVENLLAAYAPEEVVKFISDRFNQIQKGLPDFVGPQPYRAPTVEERLKGIETFKKVDLAKLKAQQKRKQVADFKEKISSFKDFKSFQSKGEIIYTKIGDNNLTEAGHKILELITMSVNYDIPNRDVILLQSILTAFVNNKIGYRDFRRLYAELLKQPVSEKFIQLTKSQFRSVAPLNVFYADPDFQKKYTKEKNYSPQFIENYNKIGALVGPLACQYVYR